MIGGIEPEHHAQILRVNKEFVHWLAPLDEEHLEWMLSLATYARQINDAKGVLIGYAHNVDYPDHWNMDWLRQHFDNFLYIDRIIVDAQAQGQRLGQQLYNDIEAFARSRGHTHLCCEVNTTPNNPGSHKFHVSQGFSACGEQVVDEKVKAVRYYSKVL